MKVTRIFNVLMALFLIAAAMANVQPAAAQVSSKPAVDVNGTPFVPGEVIVSFTSGQSTSAYKAQASALAGEVSAQVVDQNGQLALLSFAEDADVAALAAQLSASAGVAYAEPNYITTVPATSGTSTPATKITSVTRTSATGETTTFTAANLAAMRTNRPGALGTPTYPVEYTDPNGIDSMSWSWTQVHADVIWPVAATTKMVCVVDSGVDGLHPDLLAKVIKGYDFVNGDADPNDDYGHGTHVAGIIGALNGNKKGIVGVANTGIFAVKVLDAQGMGTAFDLAQGILSCANNATVNVINLSVQIADPNEGPLTAASMSVYDALETAITTKGKFVVAAAGNDSTSVPSYPAAWAAANVCRDGTVLTPGTPCPDVAVMPPLATTVITIPSAGDRNTIFRGMIAVAAGGTFESSSVDTNGDGIWVDENGDTIKDGGEFYVSERCLTKTSNYGNWVEMIAPGEGIMSLFPVSYPFSLQDGDQIPGYGIMDGTSMAAPYVAGAVSRILSVFPTSTNRSEYLTVPIDNIKTRLMDGGVAMSAVNLASDLSTDGTTGYNDKLVSGYTGEAPFCVPTANASFTAGQSMDNAVYLDVAKAMKRTSVLVKVRDASTGLPLTGGTVLTGAVVSAWQGSPTLVSKDSATLVDKFGEGVVELINLPADVLTTIKVNKVGYAVAANIGTITPGLGEYANSNEFMTVSIPPTGTGKITVVADWPDGTDLDMIGYLPAASSKIIGNPATSRNLWAPRGDIGVTVNRGNLNVTPPALALLNNFKARWNRDGGNDAVDGMGYGTESITMNTNPLAATMPFFNSAASVDSYQFFMTDHGAGNDGMLTDGELVVRVWRAGVPIAGQLPIAPALVAPLPYAYSTGITDCDSDGADDLGINDVGVTAANMVDNEYLYLGRIEKDKFYYSLTCGTSTTITPYAP